MIMGLTAYDAGNVLSIIDPELKFPDRFVFVKASIDIPQGSVFVECRKGTEIYNYQSKQLDKNTFWDQLASYFPVTYKKLIS